MANQKRSLLRFEAASDTQVPVSLAENPLTQDEVRRVLEEKLRESGLDVNRGQATIEFTPDSFGPGLVEVGFNDESQTEAVKAALLSCINEIIQGSKA